MVQAEALPMPLMGCPVEVGPVAIVSIEVRNDMGSAFLAPVANGHSPVPSCPLGSGSGGKGLDREGRTCLAVIVRYGSTVVTGLAGSIALTTQVVFGKASEDRTSRSRQVEAEGATWSTPMGVEVAGVARLVMAGSLAKVHGLVTPALGCTTRMGYQVVR